eukprot:6211723-Pleurochrysis_carterae.AAC.1
MKGAVRTALQPGAGHNGGDLRVGRPGVPLYNSKGFRCAKQVSSSKFRRVAVLHFAASNQSAFPSQQYKQQPYLAIGESNAHPACPAAMSPPAETDTSHSSQRRRVLAASRRGGRCMRDTQRKR